jgi:hypothetical protein
MIDELHDPKGAAATEDPSPASRIARLALVGVIVGAVLVAFAYAGGWLMPWQLSLLGSSTRSSSSTVRTRVSAATTPRASA